MKKKEKDIFTEIGDKFKELGEEIKPHLDKAEKKVRDLDKAIEPSLTELGKKLKELGSFLQAGCYAVLSANDFCGCLQFFIDDIVRCYISKSYIFKATPICKAKLSLVIKILQRLTKEANSI